MNGEASKPSLTTRHGYVPPSKFEVLYFIGRYGSPHQAARKMPYGVTPATLSRKLCDLERQIQLVLYERETHQLTRSGHALYNLHKPMYEDSPALISTLRQELPETITLGASPAVLRDYLPRIIATLRKKFPGLQINCKEGSQKQIQEWLQDKMIDVAVTILEGKLPSDYECERLARLPLTLLVPAKSKLHSAADIWRQKPIQENLIALEEDNPITRHFEEGLRQRKIEWRPFLRANSIEVAETYVAEGLGVGLSLAMPGRKSLSPGLRALPLRHFPHVSVGLVWRRKPSAPMLALIQELRRAARQLIKLSGTGRNKTEKSARR